MRQTMPKSDKASRRSTAEPDLGPAAMATAALPAQAMQPEDVYMDVLVHKLQLLNYERDFCRRKKPHRKSLNPTYFAAPQPGPGGNEQFFYFTNLAAWLLQLCGLSVPTPKEFDDPNATLQGLMQALRSLGFAPPSYPPTKLAAGFGREVCALLDALADVTLERRGFTASRPVYQQDGASADEAETADVDEDDAADIATTAAQQAEESEDGGGEAALPWSRPADVAASPAAYAAAAETAAAKQLLASTVDPVQWRLEVERVGPRLRTNLPADQRDWRQHLEAAGASSTALGSAWPEAKAVLTKLGAEVRGVHQCTAQCALRSLCLLCAALGQASNSKERENCSMAVH
ncbi:intra-flagellar transport protein 57-domain-containing protein [Scenedesmus sp. NREL 46B-D3]|nr:intra-flagellar transport protein 57-domain-containing protein [Scenedesmus sp. NREL 46B-D3]